MNGYVTLPGPQDASARNLTIIIYALYAVGLLLCLGLPAIIAIIMNYVKKDDMKGTVYESHFRWQIMTFWFALLWAVVGGILVLVLVGWAVWFAAYVWVIYRIVKGWMRVVEGRPMYEGT